MALVTSSLVSRMATSGSTGTSQAVMAARTCSRASPTAAGPVVRRWGREWSSVGRMGALVIMGLLRGPESCAGKAIALAQQIVLQVAAPDIGQLTDVDGPAIRSRDKVTAWNESWRAGSPTRRTA